jgi:hypothetical protein
MSDLRDWSGNFKPERFCVLRTCFGGGGDILVLVIRSGQAISGEVEARRIAANVAKLPELVREA